LRLAWYATSPRLDPNDPDLLLKLEESHDTPAYKRTLEIYKMHRDTCPECKAEMATTRRTSRPRPNIKPEPVPFERIAA
jgi:hypothetical protein